MFVQPQICVKSEILLIFHESVSLVWSVHILLPDIVFLYLLITLLQFLMF